MQKVELDRLLEKTVADALGVRMPQHRRAPEKTKATVKTQSKRTRHVPRELHPA
jgi:hypothetical protein